MTSADLQRRASRLALLAAGLAREASHIRTAEAPLLWLERRAYFDALRDAASDLESARLVLAKALQRLQGA